MRAVTTGFSMRVPVVLVSMFIASGSAIAAEPAGDWRVADGSAVIRIENCGGALWGIVAWERSPGRDTRNPDPALRGRPTLGIPILIDMRQRTPGRWEGEIYNPQNGSFYSANLQLAGDNTLRMEGCVLGGFFCGGQQWTRAQAPSTTTGRGGAESDVCSRIANFPRRPH
jgi:uncharacterized protein (DUF2147 family)